MNITKKIKMNKFNIGYHLVDGAGAGVSVNPVAFLVIQGNVVKLLPVNHSTSLDKLLDYIPDLFERVNNMANRCLQNKKEQTEKILNQMQKRAKELEKKEQNEKEKVVEVETKIEEKIEED